MIPRVDEDVRMQLAHVLFVDIVGYSKLLTNEQRELLKELNAIIRSTDSFQSAEKDGKLIRLPTGDGMALAFFTTPEAPVRCAVEIAQGLKREPRLQVRMGINSGPVDAVEDVNDRSNVAGAGINFAQRVMDCADAGHILLSKRVADDLAQYAHWKPYLHDLGEVEVKHGVPIALVNFYSDEVGNAQLPSRLQHARDEIARAQRRKLGAIAALILFVAGLGGWLFFAHKPATVVTLAEKGIAVLPFVNLSEDKENAFFTDGMQDEVLSDLARIAELKVISRTSVMQYRDTAARNLRDIAGQLGVAYLVEGSVQRAAGKVRVIAQLIDARSDSHVWAKTFDRPLEDVFAVQSEIAETIAQQLHAHISPQTRAAIEAKPTSDLVAYDLYLQAAQLWHNIGTSKDWEGDTRKGIDFLGRAVERDPQFGIAYGLLTELNLNLYSWVDHSMAREQRAKAALEQAMRAAPEAGETYIARAAFYNVVDHNPDAVLEMLQHAVQLMPGDSNLLVRLANNQARHGLWDEAVRTLEKGRELDPRGPNIPNNLKTFYEAMRQYAKCDKLCDEAIAAFPDGPGYFLAEKVETARHRGDTKLARARLAAIPKEWDPSGYRSFLAILIAIDDRNYDEAAQLFASLNRENVRGFLTTDLAILEAFVARKRGEEERARSIIERAREAKSKEVAEHPNENTPLSELAELDACLGRKEDAVREAERAVELRPISRDAVAGPEFVYSLAKVCATTGDHDRAIQLLGEVASIPAGPSYGQLLMPTWDELRGDPRFEKIVASLKPKEK